MKKLKKVIFVLLAILISSCCKSRLIDVVSFSEPELAVNPYTGSEILKFIDDSGWFHNTYSLRGKQYYDVYAIPGHCPYPDRLQGDSLFYSESEGILGIKFSDGNLWTIIN